MPRQFPIAQKGFSPFLDMVGVTFNTIENGYSQATLQITDTLLNSTRIVHGGATFTLADCGMGAALFSILDENERVRTVETQIVYFKGVGAGTLVCDTKVINRSRTIAILESEIKHNGELVAKAIGTFSIVKGRQEWKSFTEGENTSP
jgi:acyl-CoA thioesterase